jgi:hypothetical protein
VAFAVFGVRLESSIIGGNIVSGSGARTHDDGSHGRSRWLIIAAGLAAGLAAFGVGEATYRIIPARRVMLNTMGTVSSVVTAETQTQADVRNASLAFVLQGEMLGAFLGAAGGLIRRSRRAAVGAGLLGSVLAAGVAGGVSIASLPWFVRARVMYSDYDMAISIAMHGLIWGLTGASAGLALAVGAGGGPRRIAAGCSLGLFGAALGSLVFDAVGAGVFPLAETGDPVSLTWPSRLTARLLVALATAGLLSKYRWRSSPSVSPTPGPSD